MSRSPWANRPLLAAQGGPAEIARKTKSFQEIGDSGNKKPQFKSELASLMICVSGTLTLPCFATPERGGFQGPAETPKPSLSAPQHSHVRSSRVTCDQMTFHGGTLHALSQPPLCCQHRDPTCQGGRNPPSHTLLCVPLGSNEDEPLSRLGVEPSCFSSDCPPPHRILSSAPLPHGLLTSSSILPVPNPDEPPRNLSGCWLRPCSC